ncbi:hypothetical protein V8E53_014856 [Lactarius tabidus]
MTVQNDRARSCVLFSRTGGWHLTARHKSKRVRNPRVKKRQKFEAKKVIASQKPVFKAGAGGSTWYGGERMGVSTVVKSVRF